MTIHLLFLIPIFIIGIICSYTDLKYNKIKNKWLAVGFIWVFLLYLSLFIYNLFFIHQQDNYKYLLGMISNGVLALILGYFLWSFKFWAAGDAKLFALFAFLFPPEFYSKTYFAQFPAFLLLINIFVPLLSFFIILAMVFILKKTITVIRKGEFKFSLKDYLNNFKNQFPIIVKNFFIFIFIFIALQLFFKEVLSVANFITAALPSFYLFLGIYFLFHFALSFIKKHKFLNMSLIVFGIFSFIYLIISSQTIFLLNSLKTIAIFMFFVSYSKKIIDFYIEHKEIQTVKPEAVKAGMFISSQGLSDDLKAKIGNFGKMSLSEEQAGAIREISSGNILVYRTFALAPFIFLGAILTIITKESFLVTFIKVALFIF